MFARNAGKETLMLRVGFLLPLAGVVLVTVLLVVLLAIRHHADADIEREAQSASSRAGRLYREEIVASAALLGATMEVLSTDETLRQGLAQRDRARLLHRAAPLFAELKRKYSITHLYFSDSRRVNILRVHQPGRFGDTIARITTLQAARSGQTSYGVELGPLGTFTLRLVRPWFAPDGHVLGYVELGMEIDHVLRAMQHIGNVRTYVLIDKRFLDRKEWEDGMRSLGRTPDWDQFPEMVVNNQAAEELPSEVSRSLRESMRTGQESTIGGTSAYRAVFLPLTDAGGRRVGKMVLLLDVSPQVKAAEVLTLESSVVAGAACVILLAFFYWVLGIVGRQLAQNQQRLRELASHDDLTGLYNHRTYYAKLDEELIRRRRTGTPVSVLMLDIDNFKQVNDTWGHLAGDAVLIKLGALLIHSCRAMDAACRYGGEELAIILPETDTAGAREIADRMRRTIESYSFDMGNGTHGRITVSIGVATSSDALGSSRDLTGSADRALYRAKEAGRNRVEVADK